MDYKIMDLTHVLIPGEEQYTVEIKPRGKPRTTATGDIMHDLYLWSHSGTLVEVSRHFYAEGKTTADFAPDVFVGPCRLLDFREKKVNEAITLEDLKAAGDIRVGDIVILWEGREHQYRTKDSHQRPYLAHDAAEWLIHDRKIKCLGTDSSGFEVRGVENHPNHHLFFKDGVDVPVIECLRNLGAIERKRFFFSGAPIPCRGLDASPIRAMGFVGGAFELV